MAPKKKRAGKPTAKKPTRLTAKQVRSDTIAALSSTLLGRARLAQRAGLQFGGKRDLYTVAGYPREGELTFAHFWSMYKRGDVAGRIVDMPAKTTWRTPPEISEEDHEDGTPFTEAWIALAKRLRVWRYFERADRLAGVGEYSVLMLGTRDGNANTLRTPLPRMTDDRNLVYLSVYHQANADIDAWVTDTTDPRYGMPALYKLRASQDTKTFANAELTVHASRVIHIAEDLLEDEVYGRPRLERAFNRLFDIDKVAASTAEAYWQNVARILQAKIDPEAELTEAVRDQLRDEMAEMIHDLRRQFIGQGAELGWLGAETPNPDQVVNMYFSLLAGASGIPKRILFGSELGELASTTDQATYLGMINERQEQFAEPQILRAFIDRLVDSGMLPAPTTGEYTVTWPTLFEESETEKADANLKRAQTAAALTPVGGDPRELVEIDEENRNVWLLPQTPEEAEERAEENKAAAEAEVEPVVEPEPDDESSDDTPDEGDPDPDAEDDNEFPTDDADENEE